MGPSSAQVAEGPALPLGQLQQWPSLESPRAGETGPGTACVPSWELPGATPLSLNCMEMRVGYGASRSRLSPSLRPQPAPGQSGVPGASTLWWGSPSQHPSPAPRGCCAHSLARWCWPHGVFSISLRKGSRGAPPAHRDRICCCTSGNPSSLQLFPG